MAQPINHLAGQEGSTLDILRQFTDDELREQAQWLSNERERLLAEPPDGKTYGNRYSAYRYLRLQGLVDDVLSHRTG